MMMMMKMMMMVDVELLSVDFTCLCWFDVQFLLHIHSLYLNTTQLVDAAAAAACDAQLSMLTVSVSHKQRSVVY